MNWVFSFNPLSNFDVDNMIVFMSILNFVAAMHSGGFYQFLSGGSTIVTVKLNLVKWVFFFEDRFPSLRNFVNKKVGKRKN